MNRRAFLASLAVVVAAPLAPRSETVPVTVWDQTDIAYEIPHTWYVGPGHLPTIAAALDLVTDGDTIIVFPDCAESA